MTKKRPGPLAPPDRSRPSRKTTALSYSWTTFTVTQSEKGSVTRTSIKETKVRNIAQIPGPSGSAEKRKKKRINVGHIVIESFYPMIPEMPLGFQIRVGKQ